MPPEEKDEDPWKKGCVTYCCVARMLASKVASCGRRVRPLRRSVITMPMGARSGFGQRETAGTPQAETASQPQLSSETQLWPSSLRFAPSCETAWFIRKLRQTWTEHGFAPARPRGLRLSLRLAESCSLLCQVGLDEVGSGAGPGVHVSLPHAPPHLFPGSCGPSVRVPTQ